ncbi:MAG: hypothetical protein ACOC5T_07165 [Elusimicrobiota bacterium]
MEIIKKEIQNNPDKVNDYSKFKWLEIFKKDDRGVPMPTGTHTLKVTGAEEFNRTTQYKGKQEGVIMKFKEGEEDVQYFVPKWKDGEEGKTFHYLFTAFADIEKGDIIEMEGKRKGKDNNFTEVRPLGQTTNDDIPIVDEPEYEPEQREEQAYEEYTKGKWK